ncbi:MAG: porin family protein [Deferribacteres bacterium]|nr:porin family protein [Deferribacteres bacterium]
MRGIEFSSLFRTFVFLMVIVGTMGPNAYALDADGWSGNANLLIGVKSLDEDDWNPLDEQTEIGIGVDFKQDDWPVSGTIGYLFSSDDDNVMGVDIEGNTSELYFGVRKIWELPSLVRPFVGGGLALVNAKLEAAASGVKVTDDDSGIGIWIGGGAYLVLSGNFNIGVEFRYSRAEVTLFNTDVEAGGLHYGVTAGYHW